MTWNTLTPLVPEIFLFTMLCVILVVDAFSTDRQRVVTFVLSILTLLGTLFLVMQNAEVREQTILSGTFVVDSLGSGVKAILIAFVFLIIVYSRRYVLDRQFRQGEYLILILFSLLGMMVISSAGHFVSLYLGLELMSLPLYALTAMRRDCPYASEAAMKYFFLGAMASAFLLFGMSLLYGVSGSLELSAISAELVNGEASRLIWLLGVVFIAIGIAFKFGLVPFHMWVPDVYQGAPTSIAMLISSAPKVAAFIFAYRLLSDGLQPLSEDWQQLLMAFAVLSIAVGNVVALVQASLKRLLAYSAIAHMGYFALGLIAANDNGYAAALHYAVVYGVMTLAAFGMLIIYSQKGYDLESIGDLSGLAKHSPWMALMFLLVLMSMAGIPPLVGFWAKLEVLKAVINVGYTNLAVIAAFFSIVGLYYYLKVVKVMWFDSPTDDEPLVATKQGQLLFSANCLALLAMGLLPESLLVFCRGLLG